MKRFLAFLRSVIPCCRAKTELVSLLREIEAPQGLTPQARDPRYIRDLGRSLRAGHPLPLHEQRVAGELLLHYARFLPLIRAAIAKAVRR